VGVVSLVKSSVGVVKNLNKFLAFVSVRNII